MIQLHQAELMRLDAELLPVRGYLATLEAYALMVLARESAKHHKGRVVEIGSYCGKSTIALSRGCAKDEAVVCVDHFKGSPELKGEGLFHFQDPDLKETGSTYETFRRNVDRARVEVEVMKMASEQAATEWIDRASHPIDVSIRLLFIDAGHDYAEASFDYEVWGAWVQGYIALHGVGQPAFPGGTKLWDEIPGDRKVALIDSLGVVRCP